ncbi:MAG: hypothetical protein HC848_01865 [Limnobacter sp.]|nr:hypothetical protein [Limnobacter sp.]
MNKEFDIDQAIEKLKSGKALTGEDGVFTPLLKQFAEVVLNGEIDAHWDTNNESNRRNGRTKKP